MNNRTKFVSFHASIAITLIVSILMVGCAMHTPPGLLFTNVTEGVAATESSDATSTGEACSLNILGLISVGDSSIDAAKKDGDISIVSSLDRRYQNVFFFYGRTCTIVRGK